MGIGRRGQAKRNLVGDYEVTHPVAIQENNGDVGESLAQNEPEKLSTVIQTASYLSQQFLRCLSELESQIKSIPPEQKPLFLEHAKRLSQLTHQFTFDIMNNIKIFKTQCDVQTI